MTALKSDGTVCTWGLNSSGQLGDGTTNNSNVPICLAASNIVAFAAGQQYNVAVDSLGAMFTWGRNSWGQLGDGTLVDEHSPLAISGANYAWRVAKPVFSMTSGTYTSVTTVYVTVATPGATIRYTQNGSEPTISDPVVESGGGISVTETQTLTAKAWKSGMPESASTSAVYTMKVATPAFSPAGGNFNSAQSVSITSTTAGATLRYTTDGSTPTASSTVYSGPITVATTTTIKSAGFKTNWSASDIRTATFNLSFGSLAAPTASPGAGTFEGQVTVTLSAAPGTTIRYTTNGADPTTASPVYSQPLVIAVTTTLKAKAFSPDYAPSPTLTQVYTIRTTTPILSLAGGTYAPGTLLVVSNPDATATTRITLTGVDPVASDAAVVSGTTMLAGSFTLKARAFKAGCVDSLIATASYALTDPLGMGAVSSGTSHSLLATPGGLIYGWGLGSSGQIGDGGTSNRSVPTLVQPLTGVVSLSAGAAHSLAATYDGRVFAWGSNGSGRLGDGTTQNQPRPVQVASLTNVVSVAAGGAHSLALTADGFVYAWGSGTNGVLGLGNTSSTSWPTLIPTLSNVIAIAAGNTHSLAVTSNGTVYAWGANNFWQLGDGTTQARNSPAPVAGLVGAVAVTAGTSHSAVRLQNGDLYLWGSGTSGQLGLGAATNRTTPTLLPDFKALSLVAGGSFTAALRNDGVLMAWGANASGQIGDTTTQQRNSPATVVGPSGIALFAPGGTHSIAVTSYGHVWSWGAGGSGQLGDGTTVASRPTPQDVFAITGTWGATSQPILSAGTGVYHDIQSITVSNPMTSAVMHYTTSGNVPAETDPTIASGSAVLVDRTLTLRVRAWAPGYPASEVTTGVFSLTPLSPTISPTGGPFTVSQAVTMSTATPNAVVRYTVDGSNPTGTSTAYSGPVTVSTFTTIKARAFYPAWTPSDLSSGTLSFQYGTLQPPTASSPSGMYPPDHVVSLSAEPDTTIKYTLDGTDPGPSSPTYTAPITFPVALTTLKARAYRVDFAPSVVATWTYQVTSDFTPPEITAHISPAPNANGWYHTDPEISFTCTDQESGVASCPSTVTQPFEGANIAITREAVDNVGNRASITVAVNLDKTQPTLTVHNVEDGDTIPVGTTQLTVHGNAADFTSGVSSVTCNGTAATITEQRYTCNLSLSAGGNTIHIVAEDQAGNSSSRDFSVTVGEPPPPTSIEITPATMTLLPDERRELHVNDQRGRAVAGGTFTVANALVAQIEIDEGDTPFVRALNAGQTTVTLTRNGLTAEATVTVLPAGTTDVPNGTALWALGDTTPPAGAPTHGRVLRATPNADVDDDAAPALFFVEYKLGGKLNRIRATTWEGREIWRQTIDEEVKHVAADSHGGLILVKGSTYPQWGFLHDEQRIQRLNGATGRVDWEYVMHWGSLTEVAIHPDGTVYTVETLERSASLLALDGQSGLTRYRLPLSNSSHRRVNSTAPLVRQNGSVVLIAHRFRDWNQGDDPETVFVETNSATLTSTESPVETADAPGFLGVSFYYDLDRLVDDGHDGMLLVVSEIGMIYRLGSDSLNPLKIMANVLDLRFDPFDWYPMLSPQVVVGENSAYALSQVSFAGTWPESAKLVQFDPVSLDANSSSAIDDGPDNLLHSATVGGGAMITGPAYGNAQETLPGLWAQWAPAPSLVVGAEVGVADSVAPYWQGNAQASNAPARAAVSVFVGVDPLTPEKTAAMYEDSLRDEFKQTLVLNVFRDDRATSDALISELQRNQGNGALAIVTHGTRGVPDAQETIGIKLYDKWLISSATNSVPRAPDGTLLPFATVPSFTTRTPIVFVAACWIGPLFRDLWRFTGGAGAFVYADAVDATPTALIPLNRAAVAWQAVLRRLTGQFTGTKMTIGEAVDSVNASPIITEVPSGEMRFVLSVAGNRNAKLR